MFFPLDNVYSRLLPVRQLSAAACRHFRYVLLTARFLNVVWYPAVLSPYAACPFTFWLGDVPILGQILSFLPVRHKSGILHFQDLLQQYECPACFLDVQPLRTAVPLPLPSTSTSTSVYPCLSPGATVFSLHLQTNHSENDF